jgi:hypothetical protein
MAGTHAPPQPMNPRRVDSVIADVFNFADVASLQNFMQSFAFLFAAGDRSRKYVRLAALHDPSGVPRSRARQFPVSRIYRGGSRVTGIPRTQSRQLQPKCPFRGCITGDRASRYCSCFRDMRCTAWGSAPAVNRGPEDPIAAIPTQMPLSRIYRGGSRVAILFMCGVQLGAVHRRPLFRSAAYKGDEIRRRRRN